MGEGALERLKHLIDETVNLVKEFEEELVHATRLTGDEAEDTAREWMLLAVHATSEGLEPDDVRVILTQAMGVDFMEKRHGDEAEDRASDRLHKRLGGD